MLDAGKQVWIYYQKQYENEKSFNADASLYEIREYFRGRDENGRLKSKSTDEEFQKLDDDLKEKMKILAGKIVEKVYEYEFLLK